MKHNEHTSGSHLERYRNFRYISNHKKSGQISVHVFVLQLLFPILKGHLSTTFIQEVGGKERVCLEIAGTRLWSVHTEKYATRGHHMLVQWFPS